MPCSLIMIFRAMLVSYTAQHSSPTTRRCGCGVIVLCKYTGPGRHVSGSGLLCLYVQPVFSPFCSVASRLIRFALHFVCVSSQRSPKQASVCRIWTSPGLKSGWGAFLLLVALCRALARFRMTPASVRCRFLAELPLSPGFVSATFCKGSL